MRGRMLEGCTLHSSFRGASHSKPCAYHNTFNFTRACTAFAGRKIQLQIEVQLCGVGKPQRSRKRTVAAWRGVGGGIQGYTLLYTLVRSEFLTTNILYFCVALIYFFKIRNQSWLGRKEGKQGAGPRRPNPLVRKQIL